LANYPAIHLTPGDTDHIRHGRLIAAGAGDDSMARAYAADGALLAVLERRGDVWKALRVFDG
jgi:hypothetical protein